MKIGSDGVEFFHDSLTRRSVTASESSFFCGEVGDARLVRRMRPRITWASSSSGRSAIRDDDVCRGDRLRRMRRSSEALTRSNGSYTTASFADARRRVPDGSDVATPGTACDKPDPSSSCACHDGAWAAEDGPECACPGSMNRIFRVDADAIGASYSRRRGGLCVLGCIL